MMIRFLEYLRHDNRNISMYVVQEGDQSTAPSFKVNLRDGEELVTLSVIHGGNGWQMVSQNIPAWVGEIRPMLIEQLEIKAAGNPEFRELDQTG